MKVGLAAVLVATEGPIPLRFDLVAEGVASEAISDMALVDVAIVLSGDGEVSHQEKYVLVPFLMNQRFKLYEIFGYLM